MYDIRHRLIWAISGFVSAVSLLVLVSLAGYGLGKALLLSLLILALVALILWILWVSEPESLADILANPLELPSPSEPAAQDAVSAASQAEGEPDPISPTPRAEAFAAPPGGPGLARPVPNRAKANWRRDQRLQPRPATPERLAAPQDARAQAQEVVDLPDADDLLQILGVDARAAAVLESFGVIRFDQLADLPPDLAARIEERLAAPGRIAAEDWQGQAQRLSAAAPSDKI